MKNLQALIIILLLGLFLVPKNDGLFTPMKDACCKKTEQKSSCCKKDKSIPKSPSKKNACKEDCCNSCNTCHASNFIQTPFSNEFKLEYSYYKAKKNLQYDYIDPYLSDRLKEIWQPPKIV